MINKEIRELSVQELLSAKKKLRAEMFHLRVQQQSGQLEKPSLLKSLRREIARVETAVTIKSHLNLGL